MNTNLFRVALDQLEPSDWSHFESLCSQFLLPEFGNMRTTAHPSGDGGRDSELFSPEKQPFVVSQYSISSNWKTKIRNTIKRIKGEFPEVKILIFMSNRLIGGQADDLKKELLQDGILLDTRDRSWFLERCQSDSIREAATNILIDRIARPFLEGERVIERASSPLTTSESRAALVYLGLQWQDDIAEKGLTKLSFDALVRAALRHTHSDCRIPRTKVHEVVKQSIPDADTEVVVVQTNAALKRLTKRYIRHWPIDDSFCLTNDEHIRITDRLAEESVELADFSEAILKHSELCLAEIPDSQVTDLEDIKARIPRILEGLLHKRGEDFVIAVIQDNLRNVGLKDLGDIIIADIDAHRPSTTIAQHYPRVISTVIQSLLVESSDATRTYLRRLANSYTLLIFLNHTPDVQAATRKLFSHGTIWIDTTVILPLLADRIEKDAEQWHLTKAVKLCASNGIKWRVTRGIAEEINAHMNNCLNCSHFSVGQWRGRVPFLLRKYVSTGKPVEKFYSWLENFRGNERPVDDILQFLNDELEIEVEDLEDEVVKVSENLRWATERLWTEAHQERRNRSQSMDDSTTQVLIKHDIETYLGVVALRKEEKVSELGYQHWLLTLDRNAWSIRDRLTAEFKENAPPSPLMSLTYLLNSVAFGFSRSIGRKKTEQSIPVILDIELSESMPFDLVELANKVREDSSDLPEYVIRRKVRDEIDKARRRLGCTHHNPVFDDADTEE